MQSENDNFIKSWTAAIIVCALLLFAVILMVSCKAAEPTVKVKEKTVYRDRVEYIETPADSSMIEALVECSEEGQVVLARLDQELARNDRLQFSLDSLGRMKAKVVHQRDSIPVIMHDTTYIKGKTVEVEVERSLSWWQQFRMALGGLALVIAGITLALQVIKKKRM